MQSYLDLLKVLPKTNCGRCGETTCLLFSLKVFAGKISPEACPYLDPTIMPAMGKEKLVFNKSLENLKSIRERFEAIPDLSERARNLGCYLLEEGKFLLPYLDMDVIIEINSEKGPGRIRELSGKTLDPRDEILIYNYFLFNGRAPLSGDFVGLESFPHALSKEKTLRLYAEAPLAEILSKAKDQPEELLRGFRVSQLTTNREGLSFCVSILPKVILKIVYWEGSEEEGLPSECKVLFERNLLDYLDLECLVFSAERLAERLRERVNSR